MPNIFITGANRGIGLDLAKVYSKDPENKVIATTRSLRNAKDLENLQRPNIHIITLDITAPVEDVQKSVEVIDKISPEGVDVVLHNAGNMVEGPTSDPSVSHLTRSIEGYEENFQINTLGAIKVYKAIFPYWQKDTGNTKKFIYFLSLGGLVNNYTNVVSYGYGLSKAALNYFARETAFAHTQSPIDTIKHSITVAIHPGVVLTDLAEDFIKGQNLPESKYVTSEKAARQIKELVDRLTEKDNGTFERNGTFEDAHAGFSKALW